VAEGAQGIAEIVVIVWINGIQADCPANVVDRHIMFADLAGDHTQQMGSVGMSGIDGQQLAICRFSLLETAGLVVGKTALKQVNKIWNCCSIRGPVSAPYDKLRALRFRCARLFCCRSTLLAVHPTFSGIPVIVRQGSLS
jgi:hypothetical protein